MSDIAARYDRVADGFTARLDAVTDDQWTAQSPSCPDWTTRDLVAHVVGAQRSFVGALHGGGAGAPIEADADLRAAWRSVNQEVRVAVGDPETSAKIVSSPVGEMPFEQLIASFGVGDVLVHTWDLARATGGDETLDAEAVETMFANIQPLDAMIRQPGVFGPKVEPPPDADAQTRLLCFIGRAV